MRSPRIEFTSIEHNGEALRLNLDLLEEKREQALKRVEDYHRKTVRYYDQRVLAPRSPVAQLAELNSLRRRVLASWSLVAQPAELNSLGVS